MLLLANGSPLGGMPVAILAAPENRLGQFALAGTVTTATDRGWATTIAPGPSRLIEAAQRRDSTTEPITSGIATLTA